MVVVEHQPTAPGAVPPFAEMAIQIRPMSAVSTRHCTLARTGRRNEAGMCDRLEIGSISTRLRLVARHAHGCELR